MLDLALHQIQESANIMLAFKKLNRIPDNLTLFVINSKGQMVGTLTDGDIRRGFIRGLQLTDRVSDFLTSDFHYLNDNDLTPAEIKGIKNKGVKLLPVLNKNSEIIRVIDFNKIKTILPLDAVLMAGGRGERLRPLTENIPKPLLKIGNKTIIEHLMEHLCFYGIRFYHIAIRYLGEQIENYLGDGTNKGINIQYIRETQEMGTMGSVSSIRSFNNDHILVMNADLFTNIDLEDFYQAFLDQKADIAVATTPYTVDMPYAVMNLEDDKITGLKEKPSFTYHSNAGIYLIKKELFKLIPVDKFFNATDFIHSALEKGFEVIRFPIIGYWIDIGRPEDYQKVQEIAKHIGH